MASATRAGLRVLRPNEGSRGGFGIATPVQDHRRTSPGKAPRSTPALQPDSTPAPPPSRRSWRPARRSRPERRRHRRRDCEHDLGEFHGRATRRRAGRGCRRPSASCPSAWRATKQRAPSRAGNDSAAVPLSEPAGERPSWTRSAATRSAARPPARAPAAPGRRRRDRRAARRPPPAAQGDVTALGEQGLSDVQHEPDIATARNPARRRVYSGALFHIPCRPAGPGGSDGSDSAPTSSPEASTPSVDICSCRRGTGDRSALPAKTCESPEGTMPDPLSWAVALHGWHAARRLRWRTWQSSTSPSVAVSSSR